MKLLIILILTCTLILRLILYLFNYPDLNSLDPSLEYLVSSHIMKYREFPLVGTTAAQGTLSINSPLYYYFLSFFLLFFRSIFTLNAVNILLQTGMAFIVWKMTRALFGSRAGLLAVVFLSLSDWGMRASRFFFQPYLMLPFFLLSAYLLLESYRTKNARLIYASIIVYILSLSFQLSPLLYAPAYLLAVWFVARRIAGRFRLAFRLGITFVISVIVAFGSVAYSMVSQSTVTRTQIYAAFAPALDGYASRLEPYLALFFSMLFSTNAPWLLTIVFVLSVWFFAGKESSAQKRWALALLLLSCFPVFVLPLLGVPPVEHYLHIAGLFSLLYLTVILAKTVFVNRYLGIVGAGVSLFFVQSLSHNFRYRVPLLYQTAQKAANVIANELPQDVSFFQIKAGKEAGKTVYNLNDDYLFYHLIEEKTGRKIVGTYPHRGIPITPHDTEYLFLRCVGPSETASTVAFDDCIPYLMERLPYIPLRTIITTEYFTVTLMQHASDESRFTVLGDKYFQLQRFSDSEKAYRKGLESAPKNATLLAGLGNALIKQDRLGEAENEFARIAAFDPTNASYFVGSGRIAYMKGEYPRAEQLFLRAIRHHPDDTAAYFDLGKLYRITRRHDDSEQAFSRALAINPKDIGMMFGLSYLYMQYREFDKAEETLKKAIAIDPTYDGLYVALGDVYLRTRRYEEAEAMYAKAREVNPGSDLYIGLSELYMQTGRQKEAEALLKKSIEVNPKADRYQGLGFYYYQVGKLTEAIPLFQKVIEMNPHGNGYIGLGSVYQNQGKIAEAEETFKRALATPFKAQAQFALGSLYMTTKRYEESEIFLKLAALDEEMRPHAYATLGDLYLMMGRKGDAKAAYLKFQELDPGNPEATQRLNQLQ